MIQHIGQATDNGETQAKALFLCSRVTHLVKLLKNRFQLITLDTNARIVHLDDTTVAFFNTAQADRTRLCIANSV